MTKKRKLLRLAFESVTVVWLSSYRPPSVNAVSAISHKKVSVCACVVRRLIRVTLSRCDSFSHLLSLSLSLAYLVCPVSISPPSSLKSMSLFPVCFEEITDSLLQKTSVK